MALTADALCKPYKCGSVIRLLCHVLLIAWGNYAKEFCKYSNALCDTLRGLRQVGGVSTGWQVPAGILRVKSMNL